MKQRRLENISISRYKFGQESYHRSVKLRQSILLDPLNTDLKIQDYDDAENDIFIGAFLGENLIGTITLTPENEKIIKMRQLAVSDAFQNRGIGSLLVQKAESIAKELGFSYIYCHAREYVVSFYKNMGYEISGKRLIEISLPHWKMHKNL